MRAEVARRGVEDVGDHEAGPRGARVALVALDRHRERGRCARALCRACLQRGAAPRSPRAHHLARPQPAAVASRPAPVTAPGTSSTLLESAPPSQHTD